MSEIIFRSLVNEYEEIKDSFTVCESDLLNELYDLSAIKDRNPVCLARYPDISNLLVKKLETANSVNRVPEKEKRKEKPVETGRA